MIKLRTGHTLTALTLTVATLCSPAVSQEGTGVRGTLSFSQGVELKRSNLSSRTDLGFGISSATRAETFNFNVSTEIAGDFSNDADKTFDSLNQRASLRYSRAGSNSQLRFSARYAEVELNDEVILGLGDVPIISSGLAERSSVNLGLTMGVEGPMGIDLNLTRNETDYTDTTDPDLTDFEKTSADALAQFRISPAFTARVRAGASRTEEGDVTITERDSSYVGFGAETTVASGLTVTGDILFDRSEVSVGAFSRTDNGLGIELGVVQERPGGLLGFSLTSRIDDAGRRTTVEVNRAYELRDGAFGVSLGVVDQEGDDDLRLVGGLALARETKNGEYSATITQGAGTSEGLTVISTAIDLGVTQSITSSSSWSAEVGFEASDELGGEYDSRSTATISYTRDVTADWNMNTGIEYSRDRDSRPTNTVFFNLERDFEFGF